MKLRSLLALLVAGCIVAGGAFLPRFVGSRMDAQDENTVQFAQVDSVKLEFAPALMSAGELLAIQANPSNVVDIPPELASKTEGQILDIARSCIRSLKEATFFPEAEAESMDILHRNVLLFYGADSRTALFWNVSVQDPEGQQFFNLIIEDRTGLVCHISYNAAADRQYHVEAMPEVLRLLSETYLTGLGKDFLDYDTAQIVADAQSPADRSYLASTITWSTDAYGEGELTFFVNRGGFYTYFS